jgi:hypothetical protein
MYVYYFKRYIAFMSVFGEPYLIPFRTPGTKRLWKDSDMYDIMISGLLKSIGKSYVVVECGHM